MANPKGLPEAQVTAQAEMLANRVRKSFKKLHPAFEQKRIGAFRVYDWDIPEIRATVDWVEGHLVVAEYARTQTDATEGWLSRMAAAAAEALQVAPERIHLRSRRTRPAEGPRYERLAQTGERLPVREGDLSFLVNLDDFLDIGLFPDHRQTRALVRKEAQGKDFLNLFGYTGSFTCAAVKGGAKASVTVDASSHYLEWAQANLAHNGLAGPGHVTVRADAREWLRRAVHEPRRFDLCVCDPPSFSNDFDVNRDHPALLQAALSVMNAGGVIWFSTNHQRFEPQLDALGAADVRELTDRTVPPDYRRTPHRSFRIVKP